LDIAPAPQTTDDNEEKQLTDAEFDDKDNMLQKKKTTQTETETWKPQVEIYCCM